MTPISYPKWRESRALELTEAGVIIECGHCSGSGGDEDRLCHHCCSLGYFENVQAAVPSERLSINVYAAEVQTSIEAWGAWTQSNTKPLLNQLSEYIQAWRILCS